MKPDYLRVLETPPARTAEEERAAVVAWLRTIDAQYDYVGLTHLIDVIERGIPADALERQRLVDIPRACE